MGLRNGTGRGSATAECGAGAIARAPVCARRVALIAAAACLAACAAGGGRSAAPRAADGGRGGPIQFLDDASGVTISRARTPLAFAHGERRYSVSGRDYLYLGPVETDRQGVHEYYLWVGTGTTLDRGYLAPTTAAPRTLYLRLRGEWMELELHPWAERVPERAAAHPYRTPVAMRSELAARVTRDQLELMTQEPLASVRVVDADGRAADYERWDRGPAWPGFAAAAADGAP